MKVHQYRKHLNTLAGQLLSGLLVLEPFLASLPGETLALFSLSGMFKSQGEAFTWNV
jgi:hypothetical protein